MWKVCERLEMLINHETRSQKGQQNVKGGRRDVLLWWWEVSCWQTASDDNWVIKEEKLCHGAGGRILELHSVTTSSSQKGKGREDLMKFKHSVLNWPCVANDINPIKNNIKNPLMVLFLTKIQQN